MNESLKYLSQTPQRQRDEIHRLQGEVEALRRERDELCKGQEPVAEVRAANEAIQYPHLARLVDVGQLPTGSKLYLHPAPIPEGMVLVPVWVLKTAQNLANHMAKKFYPEVAGFGVFDDLAGVISQIDNMVCGIPTEAMIAAYEGEKT